MIDALRILGLAQLAKPDAVVIETTDFMLLKMGLVKAPPTESRYSKTRRAYRKQVKPLRGEKYAGQPKPADAVEDEAEVHKAIAQVG